MLQVGSVLGHMTPTNVRLDLQTSTFEPLKQSHPSAELLDEPWFRMPYLSLPIPAQQIEEWEAALQGQCTADGNNEFVMPERNVFIPADFELVGSSSANCNGNGRANANGNVLGVKRAREASQVRAAVSAWLQTVRGPVLSCQR